MYIDNETWKHTGSEPNVEIPEMMGPAFICVFNSGDTKFDRIQNKRGAMGSEDICAITKDPYQI